jgi:hypothetical protein
MTSGLTPLAVMTGGQDWVSTHETLLVGVVGIFVSGLVGPSITAAWTNRRERTRDHHTTVTDRRDDLRTVVDEAAKVLATAVSSLRPLLAAREQGRELPPGPSDLLGSLVPLGQRLRLRLPAKHSVVVEFEAAREKLLGLSRATDTQANFNRAAEDFEAHREAFLNASRKALHSPISRKVEI